jgi:ribonuclease D
VAGLVARCENGLYKFARDNPAKATRSNYWAISRSMSTEDTIIITDAARLRDVCRDLATEPFVTVDTEFMRESTYWPKLCLIQVASERHQVLIDPLATGNQEQQKTFLEPFFALMADPSVLKIFHAGRQDIEIVYHLAGLIPHPVFDTQIAAMVCGFGEAVSYTALVNTLCKQKLDKSSRFTDWSRRPLSQQQLDYAICDVTFLRDVYRKLAQQLERTGRGSWLDQEMADLTDPRNYHVLPEQAWQRMKMRVKSRKQLAVLMEVAAWREQVAQSQNVPRPRVLKDEAIYDIAVQTPDSIEALGRLRSINEGFARSARGRELVEAIKRGVERNLDGLPNPKRSQPLPASAAAVAELLRVLLKAVAARHAVAARLVATADDLEKIAVDDDADVPALSGWRRKLFGEQALALKRGELALGVMDGELATVAGPALSDMTALQAGQIRDGERYSPAEQRLSVPEQQD